MGIADMICRAIIPEEWNAKPHNANPISWLYDNMEQLLAKMKNQLQKRGEIEKLDQAIVTVNGVNHLMSDVVVKLWDATMDIDRELHAKKRYDVVSREVRNARCIYEGRCTSDLEEA